MHSRPILRALAAACALILPLLGCRQSPATQLPARSALEAELAPGALATRGAPEAGLARLGDSIQSSRRNAIVRAAERAAPAVVSVNVLRRERVQPRTVWEQFMLPPGYERETSGLGSGFIAHPDGLVITNEHVVRGATQVLLTLPDGRELDADVLGTDELNDLAVLRIRLPAGAEPLPVAPLGDSEHLLIGEWVIAIGNPLGYLLSNTEPSVTAGVVSAIGRNIIPGGEQRGYYLDMIQTDASINPGNSGGPLVNALGEVIGVNSSILSQGGGNEGLGFAIPINRARRIVAELAESGRVRRAWVGADVEPLRREGLRRVQDVRIARVAPGSPAARAGLREGMVVRAVGAKRVRTPLDWEAALLQGRVGEPLTVHVGADEVERSFDVVPADLPSVSAERIQALSDFQLVTLTPAIRAERGFANERGAMIVGLTDAARGIGLQEGDLILQVNRQRIASAEEAARALGQLSGQGAVVYFERGGRVRAAQFWIGG